MQVADNVLDIFALSHRRLLTVVRVIYARSWTMATCYNAEQISTLNCSTILLKYYMSKALKRPPWITNLIYLGLDTTEW